MRPGLLRGVRHAWDESCHDRSELERGEHGLGHHGVALVVGVAGVAGLGVALRPALGVVRRCHAAVGAKLRGRLLWGVPG